MSEGIVIALIGFAGAVLGAAIAGFATVAAAGIKGKGEGSISCGLVGLLASLGAAGGLVLGVVFGASVMQQRVVSPSQPPAIVANPTQIPPTPLLLTPTSASTASAGSFREHRQTPIVRTGVLAQGTYSDGMAPFTESDISAHLNIQRIRLEENPDGCGVAFLSADEIWFGSSVKTTLTINGFSVGTIN
jgi:hypothetical protein